MIRAAVISFILRRLASGILLVVVVCTLTFFLLYASGIDIARNLLGADATEAQVLDRARELGLDRPLVVQFADWASSAVIGDLGRSWYNGQEVQIAILSRLGVTLSIAIGAAIASLIIATILGVIAAVYRGWIDRLIQAFSIVGFAVPGFVVALTLVIIFAINLRWFRATGWIPITESFGGWVASATLPIAALAIGGISNIAQQVRGAMSDVLERDFIRTLRSRGLGSRRVILKHALRSAAGPALTVLSLYFVALLGGAVVVEQVFAIPGLGQLAVNSTSAGDVPLVMGVVISTAVIVVVVNLVVDLLQSILNPSIRID